VRKRLARHNASDTVTTMKKTLCERGIRQRTLRQRSTSRWHVWDEMNRSRWHVWDEMNRVERVHCASKRPGRSNLDVNNSEVHDTVRGRKSTVQVRRQTQCEQGSRYSWCEGQSTSARPMLSLTKPTKHTVYGVPPQRNSLVYILVWTQSYSPVRRKH